MLCVTKQKINRGNSSTNPYLPENVARQFQNQKLCCYFYRSPEYRPGHCAPRNARTMLVTGLHFVLRPSANIGYNELRCTHIILRLTADLFQCRQPTWQRRRGRHHQWRPTVGSTEHAKLLFNKLYKHPNFRRRVSFGVHRIQAVNRPLTIVELDHLKAPKVNFVLNENLRRI